MDDTALSITYIGVFLVIGAVVAIIALSKARVARARADADNLQRYRELAEQCTAQQQRTADELARVTDRLAAVEKLLQEVG